MFEHRKGIFIRKYETLFERGCITQQQVFGVMDLKHLCRFVTPKYKRTKYHNNNFNAMISKEERQQQQKKTTEYHAAYRIPMVSVSEWARKSSNWKECVWCALELMSPAPRALSFESAGNNRNYVGNEWDEWNKFDWSISICTTNGVRAWARCHGITFIQYRYSQSSKEMPNSSF